ncbi:MAG: hypothetical protein QNJ67_05865 [Kiloniellales bacterium]|nr:hypothetical protein [Kiloniellales bacterium]
MTASHQGWGGRPPLGALWPQCKGVLFVLLLCCVPDAGRAADWNLTRLAELVSEAGPGTYRFAEERYLQYLTEPLRLEGTLSYTQQGQLVRRVTSPRLEQAIIEGNLVTIQMNKVDPPVRVLLSEQPVLNALILALRATLTGDLPMLNETFKTQLTGSEQAWALRLIPDSNDLRQAVDGVTIEGRSNEIRSIEIVEANGDRSVITIRSRL